MKKLNLLAIVTIIVLVFFSFHVHTAEQDYIEELENDSKILEKEILKLIEEKKLNNDSKMLENDSKILEKEILKYIEKKKLNSDSKMLENDSKVLEKEILKDNSKTREPEPIGKTKKVYVYLYVPYNAHINPTYYYSDPYYSGWIPLNYKTEKTISGEKYWYVVYSGDVIYKGGIQ